MTQLFNSPSRRALTRIVARSAAGALFSALFVQFAQAQKKDINQGETPEPRGVQSAASNGSGPSDSRPSDDETYDFITRSIEELESEATARQLPRTSRTRSGPPGRRAANVYVDGMGRLVDLIDRAVGSGDTEIVGEAADLLSQLNRVEYVTPAGLLQARERLGRRHSLDSLKAEYVHLFEVCRTRIEDTESLAWYIQTILRNRNRYEQVANELLIPWYFIAIIHGLEASFNFLAHLHNGDYPLTRRTIHVPKGRPLLWSPPSDWDSSAVDALTMEGFVGQGNWDLASTLYRFEVFNGFGYRARGINSPYLWSFSNNYTTGKFTSDGKFVRDAKSKQCGAAVMLKALVTDGIVTI